MAVTTSPSRPTAPPSAPRFRPDIEGLRAVAVLLVIADHFWKFPSGGFVGVDVFYVISGFLITSLLLREFDRTGTVSFVGFYVRRARRILPVAVVVIAITVVVAYLIWYRPRADQTASDALAALLFVSNWHLIRLGTDYLQANGPVSPLQHFWSLAVEEQFYVVWPPVLLVLLLVCTRRGMTSARLVRTVGAVVTGGVVLSFAWSWYLSGARPAVAYFESFSRGWELGVGVLVALYASVARSPIPARVASTVVAAALVGLCASALLITPSSSFPGPWAAAPVLCTAAVILCGTAAARWSTVTLTNPVSRYLGRISYSLYLWHFPVVVFVASADPGGTAVTALISLALSLALSVASFHLVEEPVRRGRWLTRYTRTSRRRTQVLLPAVVAAVLVTMAAVQYFFPSASSGRSLAKLAGVAPQNPAVAATPFASARQVAQAVAEAADATAWPQLVPTLDVIGPDDGAPAMDVSTGCRNDVGASVRHYCDAGSTDATRTAVVIGDSVAASWLPAVEGALVPAGWRVRGLTFASCAVADVDAYPRVRTSTFLDQCASRRDEMIRWAVDGGADLVVVSEDEGTYTRQADGSTGAEAADHWRDGLTRSLDRLDGGGAAVVVLGNPPLGADVTSCATRLAGPQRCGHELDAVDTVKAGAEADAAAATGATFVDVRPWFCTDDGQCPAFAGSTLIRTDTTHLTGRYSAELATVLQPHLVAAAG